jgi:hypothetical protein
VGRRQPASKGASNKHHVWQRIGVLDHAVDDVRESLPQFPSLGVGRHSENGPTAVLRRPVLPFFLEDAKLTEKENSETECGGHVLRSFHRCARFLMTVLGLVGIGDFLVGSADCLCDSPLAFVADHLLEGAFGGIPETPDDYTILALLASGTVLQVSQRLKQGGQAARRVDNDGLPQTLSSTSPHGYAHGYVAWCTGSLRSEVVGIFLASEWDDVPRACRCGEAESKIETPLRLRKYL